MGAAAHPHPSRLALVSHGLCAGPRWRVKPTPHGGGGQRDKPRAQDSVLGREHVMGPKEGEL